MMSAGGELQLILGPMFSGKTTELLRRIRRFSHATRECIVLKYSKDDRYSEQHAVTHDAQKELAYPCETLSQCLGTVKNFDVIGIDEGQFFPDLLQCCELWANQGKVVVVAALDGTFQRKPFGSVLELIPLAEKVTKLSAVCMVCFKDAAFSKRLSDEKEVEVIGGSDKYISVCRSCYLASGNDCADQEMVLGSLPSSKKRRIYATVGTVPDEMF